MKHDRFGQMKTTEIIFCFIFLFFASILHSQEPVVSTQSKEIELVDVCALDVSIILDIRYATDDNVTKKKIYNMARCLLTKPAAEALVKVNQELKQHGLVIKIFDAYRPHSCQKLLWKYLPDPRYVADPKKGSRHNRGCAVDLTLCDLKTKKELEMPTGFDDFSEKAHRGNEKWSAEAAKNSAFLEKIMEKHGFIGLSTEWWHYDYKSWKDYPLLDIPLEDIILEQKNKD